REGEPQDMECYLDGLLLVDSWPDLTLPQHVRAAWEPTIQAAFGTHD
ncbi:MAG: Helix-turn-helix protein, partial [Actinomycetota bacterium]|nr:Helix-turn-helix protein [Actinomycetota bacterium]